MVADFESIVPDFDAQAKERDRQYKSMLRDITPQRAEMAINGALSRANYNVSMSLGGYVHPKTPTYINLREALLSNPHVKSVKLIKTNSYKEWLEYAPPTKEELEWNYKKPEYSLAIKVKRPTVPFTQKLKNIAQRFLPASTKAKIEDSTKAKLFDEYGARSEAVIAAIKRMPDLKVDADELTQAINGIKELLKSPNIRYKHQMTTPSTRLMMLAQNFENHAEFPELQTPDALQVLEQSFSGVVNAINDVRKDALEKRGKSLGFESAGQVEAFKHS